MPKELIQAIERQLPEGQRVLPGNAIDIDLGTLVAQNAELGTETREHFVAPWGEVAFRDGRQPLQVNDITESMLPELFARRSIDMFVDRDHQIIYYGRQVKAAGWVKAMRVQPPSGALNDRPGIYATIEWTPAGFKEVKDKEYRYFSPIFIFDSASRTVVSFFNITVTNDPAMADAKPIQDALAASFGAAFDGLDASQTQTKEENAMNEEQLKQLRAAFGLPADADATAVIAAANQSVSIVAATSTALTIDPDKLTPEAIALVVASQKAKAEASEASDPDVVELKTRVARMEAERFVDSLGVAPAARDKAIAYAMAEGHEACKSLLESLSATSGVPAEGSVVQQGGATPPGGTDQLAADEDWARVQKSLGTTDEQVLAAQRKYQSGSLKFDSKLGDTKSSGADSSDDE